MNIETVELKATISATTAKQLDALAAQVGGSFDNRVDELLRRGIEDTYEKYPGLRCKSVALREQESQSNSHEHSERNDG